MAPIAEAGDRMDRDEALSGSCSQTLRNRILDIAAPRGGEVAIDVGSGAGLLTLALADVVGRVWAVDISPERCRYLRAKLVSAQATNVDPVVASAVSLPLVDGMADLVVSSCCLHHLDCEGKQRALRETYRVLRSGGRLVVGDMMFGRTRLDPRHWATAANKVRTTLHGGVPGLSRLGTAAMRIAGGRWERPERPDWWSTELRSAGFADVGLELVRHEVGVVWGSKR